MAPVRGWLARAERLLDGQGETPAHAWLAVVRTYERMLTGDLPGARQWARQAIEVGSKCDPAACRHRTGGRGPAAHPGRRCPARSGAARPGRGGGRLRGPRSALDRDRLLRARVRPAGPRPVRRGRGVDRGDGAVVRDERHRQPPRALPGPPRRDPPAARVVQRGGEPGAHGLRGTAPLPATRARVAAERARTDPPPQGRHRRRGGSLAGRTSRRVGSPTGSRAGAPGPRRRGHRGRLHPRRPRAPLAGALQGATTEHRPAARAAARGAGRDRDRGRRHRPGSFGRRRAGAVAARSRARRWSPAPPSLAEGCGSPTATRRARNSPSPKRCDSGTKSAPRTRRRSHA